MKKFLNIILIISILCTLISPNIVEAINSDTGISNATPLHAKEIVEDGYSTLLKTWESAGITDSTGYFSAIRPVDFLFDSNKSRILSTEKSREYEDSVLYLVNGDSVILNVKIPEDGLYNISFDYYILNDGIIPVEAAIKINDKYQFYESRRIAFPELWTTNNEFKKDRFGNEMIPKPIKIFKWQNTYAMDASYIHNEPLKFYLHKGFNKIEILNIGDEFLLGNIYITSPKIDISYTEYISKINKSSNKYIDSTLLEYEAELTYMKNSPSIYPVSEQDPSVTPYETDKLLLNVMGGQSWAKGGQKLTWKIKVNKSGFYNIAFKYRQPDKVNIPVYRSIRIDGKVLFKELKKYPFNYTETWKNETLSDELGQAYMIWLDEGEHEISLSVNLEPVRPIIETIQSIMKEITDLTLEIQMLTGNSNDILRDWDIEEYIPDISARLNNWARVLRSQYEYARQLNEDGLKPNEVRNLLIAAKQLENLAKKPNEIPNKMTLLSQGSSSANQLLGDLQERLSEQPLYIDKFYVYRGINLPSPKCSFLTKTVEGIKRFLLSFIPKDYYKEDAEEVLEVWINRPRQYVNLLQTMADEYFTPKTGIPVKLSIMPDEQKLILANASGVQPDVALGISYWIPYELAIRGAACDLTQFDDFKEYVDTFSAGAMLPLVLDGKIYGLPETQDFWVLFYRKDILENLGVPVPNTWDEVLQILPELQRFGMNFYVPISGGGAFKPFTSTAPFIYQFGGELYSNDSMRTGLDNEECLKAVKFMSDIFTIYDMPLQVPNFYNHFRYGLLPIGISNFTTYVQLKNAATEIEGWWDIGLYPGMKNEEGQIVRWTPGTGQACMIFEKSHKQKEAWEFIKWWMSTETQVEFAVNLQTTYGPAYMWNTANMDAFDQLPWPKEDKEIIKEQWKWLKDIPKIPGAYMLERELSNTWNKIVFNGSNPRSTVEDAVITVNREIKRKMEEFGYIKDGQVIRPYILPTIELIKELGDFR